MQTPFVQNNARLWIEKHYDGALTIGKIEGLMPFWARLHTVEYHSENIDVAIDQVDLFFSPITLFLGRVSLLKVCAAHMTLNTREAQAQASWPTTRIPIDIHAMQIHSLNINNIRNVSVSGSGEIKENFSFNLALHYQEMPFAVGVEAHADKHTISIIGHSQNTWISGIYDVKTEIFSGDIRDHRLNGDLKLDFASQTFHSSGTIFDYPYVAHGQFDEAYGVRFTLVGQNIQWKQLAVSEITLEGEWQNKQLHFRLALQECVIMDPAYEVFPTVTLVVDGSATNKKSLLQGEVLGLGSTPFVLSADLPLNHFSIDLASPLELHLQGQGSIDPVLSFLENVSLIARGDIDVDLSLTGTLDNPQIEGSLIYSNGWVESLATGVTFRGINVEFEGTGRELKIRSIAAQDLGSGTLSGLGHIRWDPEHGFPLELSLSTHCFTLLAIDPFTASANAEFTLSGNIHELFVTGNATIVEGHLAIPNQIPTQIPTVDVVYVNPLPTPKPDIDVYKPTIPIYWDVHIEAPRKLTIEGRGLISEWKGTLHMHGPQHALVYDGKLKLVQGRFTVIGRTFDLTEGRIHINGLEPKEIYVNLKGDLELTTITASLIVTGSLDATQFTFRSTPPMSTNQILSWILFNQDVNELTPFQACRLANALVSLSGKYAGPKFLDNLKEGLGIDVFDITNCDFDSADFTFQVGKYISQGTFVGVNKSLSGNFDSVLIQTRLYRDFFLEANYGGSLNGLTPNGGKLIFKWYRSY